MTNHNTSSVNSKKIHLGLGAVIDGAYLWAGADRGISTEMQGKDNGTEIYYKRTKLGEAAITSVAKNSAIAANSKDYEQVDTKVEIFDSHVMYTLQALDKEITNVGEAMNNVRIGQRIARKAIDYVIPKDLPLIGNHFVGNNYVPFQTAGAYLKTSVDGKLYGFIDWRSWGKMTAQGQQAIPCALADKRFGKDLLGSWTLVDELRTLQGLPFAHAGILNGATAGLATETSGKRVLTVTLATTGTGLIKKGESVLFTVDGIYNTNVNGDKCEPFVFYWKNETTADVDHTSGSNTFTIDINSDQLKFMDVESESALSNKACTSLFESGKNYGCTIIRGEGAQCFGTMNKCACEGAKYFKSSTDGFNIHVNVAEDVGNLQEMHRYDCIMASKLVEPRAAAVVWTDLSSTTVG